MKWAMVLVGILVLSMCGGTKSAAPPTGDEPTSTTVSEESTTTSTSTMTTEPPTTTLPEEPPDLSGVWSGVKNVGGRFEEGTVLISQTGSTFTLEFSDGFECRPAAACEFDGTVGTLSDPDSGDLTYVWMASNGGSAGEDGGTYESSFGLQSYPDTYPEGDDLELPESVDIVTQEEVVVSGDEDELPKTIDPFTGKESDTTGCYVGIGESIFRGEGEEMVWGTYLLLCP